MNIVEIKNTNISIDTKNVLEAINFDLKKGEMKFLIGKTGSGKTTLVKHLLNKKELNLSFSSQTKGKTSVLNPSLVLSGNISFKVL